MAKLVMAHLFTPTVVREVVEPGRVGAYTLGHHETGFVVGYVGRSDRCLRERLAGHELLGQFDYFTVRYARDAAGAFLLECEGWHSCLQAGVHLMNRVHPGAPRGSGLACPYCHFAEHVTRIAVAA